MISIDRRLAPLLAAALALGACAARNQPALPPAEDGAAKEIVVNTDKGEAEAQAAGDKACAQRNKRASLTGYTCAEGACKVLRYTFDCV